MYKITFLLIPNIKTTGYFTKARRTQIVLNSSTTKFAVGSTYILLITTYPTYELILIDVQIFKTTLRH